MRIPDGLEPLLDYGVLDEVIRPLMSGKEAQVYLVVSNGQVCVAKVYKEAQNRSFKNRADYTEGRTTRNSRDQRAMSKRSKHGRAQDEAAWRSTEVDIIHRLYAAGVRVPVPHHFVEGVLLMEMVRDAEGNPAPRLGDLRFTPEEARVLYDRLVREVVRMLCAGVVHGDLSDFNVLIGADGPVIIDFPQSVDTARNPNARRLLLRDVENLHDFLRRWSPNARRLPLAEEMWELHEANLLTPETRLEGRYRGGRDRGPVNTDSVLSLIRDANDDERKRRETLGLRGGEAIRESEPEKPPAPPPVSRYAQKMAQRRAELAAMPVAPPPPPAPRPAPPAPAIRPQASPSPPGQGPQRPGHGQEQRPRPPAQQGQGSGPRPPGQPYPPQKGQGQPGPRPQGQPLQQKGPRPPGQPFQQQGQRPQAEGQRQGHGQGQPQGGRPQGQPFPPRQQPGPRPQGQGQGHGAGQGQGPGQGQTARPQRPPFQQQQPGQRPPGQGQGTGARPPGQPFQQQQKGQRPPGQAPSSGSPHQGTSPRPPRQEPFRTSPPPRPESRGETSGETRGPDDSFDSARRRRRRPEPVGAYVAPPNASPVPSTTTPTAPPAPSPPQQNERGPRPSSPPREQSSRPTGGRGDTRGQRPPVEVVVIRDRDRERKE